APFEPDPSFTASRSRAPGAAPPTTAPGRRPKPLPPLIHTTARGYTPPPAPHGAGHRTLLRVGSMPRLCEKSIFRKYSLIKSIICKARMLQKRGLHTVSAVVRQLYCWHSRTNEKKLYGIPCLYLLPQRE